MLLPDIEHHGAADGVTGSCHQLHMDADNSLLIDCSLFQGNEAPDIGRAGAGQAAIEFDLATVRALIVTHVHIDHVGRLPQLLAAGFKGPILCSEPSAKLLPIVLEDAFKLGVSRDQKKLERYIQLVERRMQPLPYGQWFMLQSTDGLNVRIRLQRAGHILGSAYVEVDLTYPATGDNKRIVFSGDLGAPHAPLLMPPEPPERADILVLESTYGDRLHEDRASRRQRLEAVIGRALQDQGTVLIPAFSIGSTQELLYELEEIIHHHGKLSTLETSGAVKIDSHTDHIAVVNYLTQTARPAIVIAGNRMCSGGRISYLKAMLHDPRHDLFVGYQAQGTPGYAVQQYGPKKSGYVDFDGARFDIRAKVTSIGGYSAHADQRGWWSLYRYAGASRDTAGA